MRWKPIVWNRADHYAQWLSYPSRVGEPPQQGSALTLVEHPGHMFAAVGVERGGESAMVWVKPIEVERNID